MNRTRKSFVAFSFILGLAASLFASGGQEEVSDKQTYFVSILPQAYFLERIGGDRIDVTVMVPPGKSPATYEPTPRQVVELGEATAFFTIGVPFEQTFLPSLEGSLPNLPLIDTSAGIEKRFIEAHSHDDEEGHDEDHHEGEDDHDDHHDEETIDPHVWLSPVLAQTIARNMLDTLISNDPEGKSVYEANLDALIADLTTLDKELMEVMAPLQGEILFVYHPAFGYFGDHYGLVQEAIETGGKEPSAAALEEIIEHAHEESVRIIVVQPEFSQNSAKAVADAIGGVVIPMAPLEKDYINNLKMMAQTLRDNL